MLESKKLTLGYSDKIVLKDIDVEIEKGKITALIGANGCGKSTFLKAISRILTPKKGEVLLKGENIFNIPTKEVAKKMAMLPQNTSAPEDLTIYELVKQGRYPYHSLLSSWKKQDEEIVQEALISMGLLEVKDEKLGKLSGGQLQRAWIALALAQNTEYLLLDEPTNHLDIKYQLEILYLLKELNEKEKRTIIIVLHDINHALKFAHNIIAFKDGKIFAKGNKDKIVNENLIEEVFGVKSSIIFSPLGDSRICIPYMN